jgi:hypothetical protein
MKMDRSFIIPVIQAVTWVNFRWSSISDACMTTKLNRMSATHQLDVRKLSNKGIMQRGKTRIYNSLWHMDTSPHEYHCGYPRWIQTWNAIHVNLNIVLYFRVRTPVDFRKRQTDDYLEVGRICYSSWVLAIIAHFQLAVQQLSATS